MDIMGTADLNTWEQFTRNLSVCLSSVCFTDASGLPLSRDEGLQIWYELALNLRKRNGCLFFVGNGASSSMSSHFAADLNKNALMRTQIFTDAALITAISNDASFESVYADPLSRMAVSGDMLVSISSSGNSPNILAALEVARKNNLDVITLSGMNRTNHSRKMGHLNIYAPSFSYGIVETVHGALLHHWTDLLVASAHKGEV